MKTQKLEQNKRIQTLCKHYWLIEPPTSETSFGICKYCGVTREFTNYIAGYSFVGNMYEEYISQDDEFIAKNSEDEIHLIK